MMKYWASWLLMFTSLAALAQPNPNPTEAFTVTGQVTTERAFTLADLEKFPTKKIDDVLITNHLGEPRGTAKQLSGILVKEVLQGVALPEASPKKWSEFYFVFVAADGYKVVYSWNEIFNSATGDHLYFITARDGKGLREMDERILVLTPSDFKTGRRHVKALANIVVKRAE
jgi:hypothetical protein